PVYAEMIVKEFWVKTLEVIDKTPHRLTEVPGLGAKRVEKIKDCWSEQKGIRNVMIFLQAHQVRPSFAQKIFRRYGEESIDKVKENPYALAKEIYGIGFKSADELAQNLGIAKDSPLRIKAGIEHVLWELSNDGHVCYPKVDFIPAAEAILEVEGSLINDQISALELEGHIMVEDLEGLPHLWVRPLYNAEWGIARELKRIHEAPCNIRPIILDKAVEWAQEKHRIRFAKEQKVAITKSLEEKIHIITGGPGTGKSTITRAILSITSRVTDKITLAAPTGRAAKRMTEITGKKAFTIHSLLEFDFNEGGFKRTRENPLTARLLIIDEASMIDTQLMYHLLKAIPDETRIIFIGDIDQLPSVGAGNVLKDMIQSETIPMTRLKWIFRQGKGSRIVANAHRINAGYFPETEHEQGSDFVFFNVESPDEILAKITDLIEKHIPEKFPFDRIDDIQVLSPMKKGIIGTDNINHALQQRLNPQDLALERMGRHFHFNDKVMQIRNNYDKKVFNGDVGRIVKIDTVDQEVQVDFEGLTVPYDFSELDELVLAYAVSIHKYQGSECPCVVIPVHTSHFKLLYRNLLYTGITRGKKRVILIGTKKALAIAIKNNEAFLRHTGLMDKLMLSFDLSACSASVDSA
ncbi:MAG: ATP-dependent RecD-like DNA helicase, partial [Chlamydiia bacterium]|nr:ATP-dependent RecD-like DNA helicase [Chlamydiia bacterium]